MISARELALGCTIPSTGDPGPNPFSLSAPLASGEDLERISGWDLAGGGVAETKGRGESGEGEGRSSRERRGGGGGGVEAVGQWRAEMG